MLIETKLAVLADYGDLCGECPIWDWRSSTLYWTDCVGRHFYRYSAGQHRILKEGLEINGFRLNRPGGFVIVNNSGIWLWDGADELKLIAAEVDGWKCQMNDCAADPAGRLFSGTCHYAPDGEYPLGKLVRVDTDGRATIVDEGFHLSNGLGFSLDCRTLYCTDSVARAIYAYDYQPETGDLRNRRIFVEVPRTEGLPDGLTVDAEGFVWSAQWYGSCAVRYDPDGKLERRVHVPAKQTSSVALGGEGLRELFITSAARSEPMPVMPDGYDPTCGYFGGALFHGESTITGKFEFEADIRLAR